MMKMRCHLISEELIFIVDSLLHEPEFQVEEHEEDQHGDDGERRGHAGLIEGEGVIVALIDDVGAGVVRPALGEDLDGREDVLEPLHDGHDEDVYRGGRGERHHDLREDVGIGRLLEPGRLDELLGHAVHAGEEDEEIVAEGLVHRHEADDEDDEPRRLGPRGKRRAHSVRDGAHRPGDGVEDPLEEDGPHDERDERGREEERLVDVLPFLHEERIHEGEHVGQKEIEEHEDDDVEERILRDGHRHRIGEQIHIVVQRHELHLRGHHVPLEEAQVKRVQQGIKHEEDKYRKRRQDEEKGKPPLPLPPGGLVIAGSHLRTSCK